MAATTVLPSLSQVLNWDTAHLIQAADDWGIEAQKLENTFEQNYKRLADTDWQGQGREACLERAGFDLVKVRGPAGQIREAAIAARYGFDQQNGAKELALDAVRDAGRNGFRPNEDLSVSDLRTGDSAVERAARQAQAQVLSAQIRHRVGLLVASNQEVAAKITAAAGDLGRFGFDELKPGEFVPLSAYNVPPDVILTWCDEYMSSWLCSDYYPDGTRDVYRHHNDRTGVWP